MPSHSDPASDAPDRSAAPSPRRRLTSLLILALAFAYVSAFWGGAARRLPVPVNKWAYIAVTTPRSWWQSHVALSRPPADRYVLLLLTTDMLLGFAIPALVLGLCGRRPSDLGWAMPNPLGRRIILAGFVLSVPFGLWLLYDQRALMNATLHLSPIAHARRLLSMIPEHFLICGTITALMLAERRLPGDVPAAPIDGPPLRRMLRWLGLAQPPTLAQQNRVLAWLGLTSGQLFAVAASGLIFGLIHIGKGNLELALSFPGGAAVAYMTLRSHSIWPAILAHWSMNLVPAGLWLLWRGSA